MDFFKNERLNFDNSLYQVNGKKFRKYADILVYEKEKYSHVVFVKSSNYYTLLMDDFITRPTFDVFVRALRILKNADFSVISETEKPNVNVFDKVLRDVQSDKLEYSEKNYIFKIQDNKKVEKNGIFCLNHTIPIESATIMVTNIDLNIEAKIRVDDCKNILGYDQMFSVSVNGEPAFQEMLCMSCSEQNGIMNFEFVSEHQYFMKRSLANKTDLEGTQLWIFQVTEYSINIGRDEPILFNFDGKDLGGQNRRYFFVFSISGIKIKKDLRFGLVNFSNESGMLSEREDKYRALTSKMTDCYAQLVVQSDSLRNATEIAEGTLNKALNLLRIMTLIDSPIVSLGREKYINDWRYEILDSTLEYDKCFYVEDILNVNNNAILSSENKFKKDAINISEGIEQLLSNDNIIEEFFYSESTKERENLLQAIFWLNISYEQLSIKDRVISLYISVEFLISKQKGVTLKEQLSEYTEFNDVLKKINESVSSVTDVKLKERMQGIINNSFGSSSVKSRLETLVGDLGMSLTQAEWELFDLLKINRQKLIHNKQTEKQITNQQLDELYHIFSRIIIEKMMNLSGDIYD